MNLEKKNGQIINQNGGQTTNRLEEEAKTSRVNICDKESRHTQTPHTLNSTKQKNKRKMISIYGQ